ncbi:MAG: hypothetical protein II336_17565 [Loktanella sp.]|nr:hypothetical protein [Loktanella sp.]
MIKELEIFKLALIESSQRSLQDLPDDKLICDSNSNKFSDKSCEPLIKVLESIPVFANLDGQYFYIPGRMELIKISTIARRLMFRARLFPADVVVTSFISLVQDMKLNFMEVRLLSGIETDKIIDVSESLKILPISEVTKFDFPPEVLSKSSIFHSHESQPSAALVRTRQLSFEILSESIDIDDTNDPRSRLMSDATTYDYWRAALFSILVASDGPIQFQQAYSVVADPGWLSSGCAGWSSGHTIPVWGRKATVLDAEKIATFFDFLSTADKRVLLALSRLQSARLRRNPEDQAIDLGICAEILLMANSNDNAEISYKLATRAAWLIDGGPSTRVATFDAVKNLYNRRSSSVHSGRFWKSKEKDDLMRQKAEISQYDKICCDLLSAIVKRGQFNDEVWKKIILNADDI